MSDSTIRSQSPPKRSGRRVDCSRRLLLALLPLLAAPPAHGGTPVRKELLTWPQVLVQVYDRLSCSSPSHIHAHGPIPRAAQEVEVLETTGYQARPVRHKQRTRHWRTCNVMQLAASRDARARPTARSECASGLRRKGGREGGVDGRVGFGGLGGREWVSE